ncbi:MULTISPECIES: SdrD B-like domain-containing protein [unclassified Crossiella]|uniref:SdrD B-like domain-containing protein n=1 Tax=unclassified Crossiella TaxID=2620835 RepID=UPI001FFEEC58|nr:MULTISPECIES: SdrD B-like domain-containing protein [unclassified Crossiella]MCK2236266.1 carboxypeptidase regulatory-like domain-containing protein [Crossiella sp. S99.2]MCK2249933.1 carboxypeptidase regulatory-like domain-containing protein [Crossiella sp. S99.1]
MSVVRDLNGNGTYEPALELGVAGIPVTVTDPSGGSASGNTGADGAVTVALGSVTGGKYRVEATIPADKSYLKPAPAGTGLSSLTEFVDVAAGKNVALTMGVWNPADYCQANPTLATACERDALLVGQNPGARSLVSFPFTARAQSPAPTQLANQGQTGTVYGMAYRKSDKRLFSGAFAKRLGLYGPGGAGAIYVTTVGGATSQFATVPNAGSTAHAMNTDFDGKFFGVPGKESLGDLEISEDGKDLYVVNMADKKLYVYDATAATASAPKGSYAIPATACASAADWRPGALGARDGVVYVGGVCSGGSSQRLAEVKAAVFPFTGGAFGAAVVNKTLDFQRGEAFIDSGTTWHPWLDTWDLDRITHRQAQFDRDSENVAYPQPLMTDIGVETDGDLVLGFRDRFGDQLGQQTPSPDGSARGTTYNAVIGGDYNRVCKQASGSFSWEGTAANCPNNNTGSDNGNEPASVVEYYPGEFFRRHAETAMGAVAIVPGASRMPATVMDPLDFRSGGIGWFDRANGTMQNDEHSNAYEVLDETSEGWGKANGLGDLEALCDQAPVQIGNRVWFDADSDGVQDGGEPALPGVKVTLQACGSSTVLGTKTTDAKGQYYFGAAEGVQPESCYTVKFDYSAADTSGLPGAPPPATLNWTGKEAGPSRTVDSNVDPATSAATVTVGPAGADDHSVDAGVTAAPPNKLGDLVWVDTNRNGVQDTGEPPVPGVKVTAKKPDGSAAGTTTTDATGKYLITPLPDGAYTVCFDLSGLAPEYQGYLLTRPNAGGADAKDSDPDPATGCTASTTLGPDKREDLTLDAGIRPGNRLGDYVWIDANKDGVQDAPESPVAGVPVILKDGSGAVLGNTTTNASGQYLFDKLKDGAYQVCFDLTKLPAGVGDYVPTKANTGTDDAKDSDADPATGCTATTTLNIDKPEDLTLDAGLVPPVNQLGDYVWIDTNKNGLQDAPETGVEGVKVTLLKGDGAEVGSTSTDANGKYLFTELPDGSYQVCFSLKSLPQAVADYLPTTPNAGADTADSDADPATGCTEVVELGAGKRQNLTLDAGLVNPPNKLGDYVWVDSNKNGLQDTGETPVPGVTVVVKDGAGATVGSTITDEQGKYLFDKLPDGKFSVCFDLKSLPGDFADYQVTKRYAGDDGQDSDADPASGCTEAVDLGPGKRENLTLDAGLIRPVNRLGDYVWVDANKNGVQDTGETPVPGVTAVLRPVSGAEQTTTTDAQGKYLFDDLPDGGYLVCFDVKKLPANVGDYTLTTANSGDDGKDSDADPGTGCTPVVGLGTGKRENLTLDAGLVAPVNRLGDYVWVDTNRNGVQDQGEPPVPGITVKVSNRNGETVTTKTNEQGKYLVEGLPNGLYQVCFDLKTLPAANAGYLPTKQDAGAEDAKDSDANADGCTNPVELSVGKREVLTVDAGLREPNRLGDYVWVDANRNGIQEAGEKPVAGVTAVLKDAGGKQLATTKTDDKGKYLFGKLPDGTYQVCFDGKSLPAPYGDFQVTVQNAGAADADSDADPATWCTKTTTLGVDKPEDLTLDAGIAAPVNRLGDYVWVDKNGNGLQDPDEPGVPGVPVQVVDKDGKTVKETSTGKDGKYLVEGLLDGNYTVCFGLKSLPSALAGYLPTKAAAGDPAKDSDADPATGCAKPVALGPGQRENLTIDAGLLAPKPAPGPGPGPGPDPWPAPVADQGKLADTGADVGWLVALGLLALGGGAGLMLLANRRRRRSDSA